MRPVTESGEKSFEVELANALGNVHAALVEIVDRNPDLPEVVRARLVRQVWKTAPLCDVALLKRMRAAYEPVPRATTAGGHSPASSPFGMPS